MCASGSRRAHGASGSPVHHSPPPPFRNVPAPILFPPCESTESEVRPVDPRDTEWEISSPSYRVYFRRPLAHGGYMSDEFELRGAADVRAVLSWAEEKADGRMYVLVGASGEGGLVKLAEVAPTEPS